MGLSGCCCLVKYLLILINFAFWAAGIAAFTLFGWFLANSTSFLLPFNEAKNDYYIGLLVVVGVATLVIIIAFLGCCGSLKESQCMLVSFFCFLLIVLVAEIATGVYAYLNQDQLMKIIRTNVKHTIQNEYGSTELPTEVFNAFQKNLECCGVDGPLDWQTSKYNNNTKAINLDVSSPEAMFIIPESCCKENVTLDVCKQATRIKVGTTKNQIDQLPSAKYIHQQGCSDRLQKQAEDHLLCILAIVAGIIAIEIFALMISLCLCCAVGDREDDYKS